MEWGTVSTLMFPKNKGPKKESLHNHTRETPFIVESCEFILVIRPLQK